MRSAWLAALLAGCATAGSDQDQVWCLKILYLGMNGSVRMYDEVVSKAAARVTDGARWDDPVLCVRYAYTIEREPDGRYGVSL
jgi:hypothetical protein